MTAWNILPAVRRRFDRRSRASWMRSCTAGRCGVVAAIGFGIFARPFFLGLLLVLLFLLGQFALALFVGVFGLCQRGNLANGDP